MKVGDLVRFQYGGVYTGIIVEVDIYAGGKDVKVLWTGSTEAVTQKSDHLKLLTSS